MLTNARSHVYNRASTTWGGNKQQSQEQEKDRATVAARESERVTSGEQEAGGERDASEQGVSTRKVGGERKAGERARGERPAWSYGSPGFRHNV